MEEECNLISWYKNRCIGRM